VTEVGGEKEILVLLDRGRKDGVVMGDRFVLMLADGGKLLFTMDRLFDEVCQCRARIDGERGPSKLELVALLERPLSLLKEPPIFLAIQAEEGEERLTRLSGAIVHSIQNERIFGGGVRIRKVSAAEEEVFDVQGVDNLLSLKAESGGKVTVHVSSADGGRIGPVTSVFPEDETTLEYNQKYIGLLGELGKALSLSPVRSLRAARISDLAAVREAYFEAVSLAAQGQDVRAKEVLEAALLEDEESYECLALLGELRMRGVPLGERGEEELLELAGDWEEALSLAEEDHLRKGFGRVVFEQDLGAYVVPPPFIVPEQQLLVHAEAGALSSAGLRRLERSISRLHGLDCVMVERVLPMDDEGVREWVLDNNGLSLFQAPRVVNGFLMLYGQNGEGYVEELIEANSSDWETWEIALMLAKRRGSMEGQVRALGRLILLESDALRVAEWEEELAAVTGLRWKREEARAIRQISGLKGQGVFVVDGDQTLIGLGEQAGEALGWVHLVRSEGGAEICGFEKVLWGGAEEQSIQRLGLDWGAGGDAVGESCEVFGELGLKEGQRILGQLYIAGRLLLVPYAETGKAGGGVVAVSRKEGSVLWNVALSGQLWQMAVIDGQTANAVLHNDKFVAVDLASGAAVELKLRSMENSRIEWCSELFEEQFLVYVETTVSMPVESVESVVRALDVKSGGVVTLVERHGGRYVHAPRVVGGQVLLFPEDRYGDGWRVEAWKQEGEELELVWERTGRGGQLASAEVLAGLLGLTNGEGEVSLLDPAQEGREVWAWKLSGKAVGVPVVEGGTLYLASVNGMLAAFDFDEILRRRNGE